MKHDEINTSIHDEKLKQVLKIRVAKDNGINSIYLNVTLDFQKLNF